MSSEVCPFCGKTYKRLKSHLPHCKAAVSSKRSPTQHDVTTNPATAAPQLSSGSSEKKSTQTKKTKRVTDISSGSPPSSPATSLKNVNTASASEPASSSSPRSSSLTSSTKRKQKQSDQIKMASVPSSTSSSPSLSPSPVLSKPKKQSLRALIEAAKSNQLPVGPPEGTISSSLNPVTSPLSSETKTDPDRKSGVDPDAKPKRASKKKASQILSKTKNTSPPLESKVNKSRAKSNFWEDSEGEREGNEILWKSESGSQETKITLQDVKTMLRRPKPSSRASILSQIENSLNVAPAEKQKLDEISSLVTTKSQSNQLLSTSLQPKALTPVKKKKSKQVSVIPLQDDSSHQSKLSSIGTSLLSDHPSSQVSRTTPLPPSVGLNDRLKAGYHMTSLTQLSNPPRFPLTTQTQTPQLGVRTENAAGDGLKGDLDQRRLGQVRLRELPEWLACKTPSHPRDVVQMMQRGWQWYYKRYIDVKRGSVGGLGMLLAGYCVLSYIWSYPHIKRDRWRKYH